MYGLIRDQENKTEIINCFDQSGESMLRFIMPSTCQDGKNNILS